MSTLLTRSFLVDITVVSRRGETDSHVNRVDKNENEQADLSLTWSKTPKTSFLMTKLV